MDNSKLRKVMINKDAFIMAFGRDTDYHDTIPQTAYLDLETGNTTWVFERDSDAFMDAGIPVNCNREEREMVEATPNRFLEVPGFDHGKHHEILREFLDSDWTDDEELRLTISSAYTGSIGGWKKAIDDEGIFYNFCDYRERVTKQMAEEFLREHGIEPEWK